MEPGRELVQLFEVVHEGSYVQGAAQQAVQARS